MAYVNLADLPQFCAEVIKKFTERQIVLLSGPLGAGKTQFVKSCVDLLRKNAATKIHVESPTFSIINEYPGTPNIFHVDLYRMTSSADIESTGFWELFENPKGLIFIEWPEQLAGENLPAYWNSMKIKIDFADSQNSSDSKNSPSTVRAIHIL